MVKKVSAAEARSHLSSLAAEAGRGGRHVIIERRGQPVAALVSIEELAVLLLQQATSERPLGALALVGGWREVDDEVLESLTRDIYSERETDVGRRVDLET